MSSVRRSTIGARRAKTPAKPPADPVCVEQEPAFEAPAPLSAPQSPVGGKLGRMIGLLQRRDGATVGQLAEALGWQAHSVRGAMAGALKARGYLVASAKTDDGRVYRISCTPSAEAGS